MEFQTITVHTISKHPQPYNEGINSSKKFNTYQRKLALKIRQTILDSQD